MTRKDYVAIADAFMRQQIVGAPNMTDAPEEYMRGAREQAELYIDAVCAVFAADNPRFDRACFLAACGVQS